MAGENVNIDVEPPKKPISRRTTQKPFEAIPVQRKVLIYHVTEQEIRSVSAGNSVSRWSSSAGWAVITYGVGVLTSLGIETSPSPLFDKVARCVIAPICGALAFVFFGIWYFTKEKRDQDIASIMGPAEEAEI